MAIVLAPHAAARADVRGLFRIGVEPVSLDVSSDTPVVGSHVDDAVTAYNTASAAYNRYHGYSAGSAMAVAPIDASALGLHTTLVTFAPGVELGGQHLKFRVEGLISLADRLRAYGAGVYPLELVLPLPGGIAPYIVAGGTVRWLDRTDSDGEVGALGTLRVAAGARVTQHIAVELGASLFAFGGLYNRGELASMSSYDPRGSAPPPPPDRMVAGGQQSGMIDVSVGLVL
jgi:hypothetical protein